MTAPLFDHTRCDVDRLSIDYVAFSYQIARSLRGSNRQARDQWLRAAQSISLNITEGNGKQSLKDKDRFFEITRGSALECDCFNEPPGYPRIESSTSTARLSTSTNPAPEPDESSDATQRKWRSDFFLTSRSLALFPPAARQRYP